MADVNGEYLEREWRLNGTLRTIFGDPWTPKTVDEYMIIVEEHEERKGCVQPHLRNAVTC